MRQCPDRYAFRAGQNLPDKEFRYLRTIIVIADVHWRFGDWLAPLPLTFQHWSGVSLYTSAFALAETCVFGKQSIGIFRCAPPFVNKERGRHVPKLRLAVLPSSLTRNHSFALGYSPCPPVSVFGTDDILRTLEVFPGTALPFLVSCKQKIRVIP